MGSPLLPHSLIFEFSKLFCLKKLTNASTSMSSIICFLKVLMYHVLSHPGQAKVHLDVGSMCHDIGLYIKGI